MPPDAAGPIAHVSDTARWVALYRAMESERADALFRDPYARRLAGERGEAILAGIRRARSWDWPHIVRTAVFDELITRCIAEGADAVLNLAAGLDARAWRLALPATLTWIEVDFPDVLAFKREQLAAERPRCRVAWEPADLADAAQRSALFSKVGAAHRRVLVVSEGLLVYLLADQVAALADDLHAQGAFHWWLIDIASPRLLKMMKKWAGPQLVQGNAEMHFAPAESTGFFAPHGWKEAEFRGTFGEAVRLKRLPRWMVVWRVLGLLQSPKRKQEMARFAGCALLERA
jgi:methyltransferase (TIGR00027 family)